MGGNDHVSGQGRHQNGSTAGDTAGGLLFDPTQSDEDMPENVLFFLHKTPPGGQSFCQKLLNCCPAADLMEIYWCAEN